jgi:hypothetical protein
VPYEPPYALAEGCRHATDPLLEDARAAWWNTKTAPLRQRCPLKQASLLESIACSSTPCPHATLMFAIARTRASARASLRIDKMLQSLGIEAFPTAMPNDRALSRAPTHGKNSFATRCSTHTRQPGAHGYRRARSACATAARYSAGHSR